MQRVVSEVLRKGIDLEQTIEVFDQARKVGVRTHGHFMIGIPGETMDDMRQTLDYASRLPAASIEFNMLTPWPGTAFWDLCRERGYLTVDDCSKFNEKRGCHITTEDFSNTQVEAFYEEIRHTLSARGWLNSSDGSVYFHPVIATAADIENAS